MDKKLSNKEMYDLLDLAAKKETDKKVSKINKELFTWFILLLIACLLPLFLMAFIPNMETASSWFQRSGSIMVVISLYAEIVALGIEKNTIRNENTFLYCNLYIENKYKKIIYILNSFTFILIASGTIIWGYGDILYKI